MTYDAMSNLSQVNQNSSLLASATYNFAGQLATLNYPGGFGQETQRNRDRRISRTMASAKAGQTHFSLGFGPGGAPAELLVKTNKNPVVVRGAVR